MLNYILETNLCWLLFYLVYALIFSRETFFQLNRWYLITTLVLGALIPLLELPDFMQLQSPQPALVHWLSPVQLSDNAESVTILSAKENLSFTSILWGLYLLGVVLSSSRFLFGLWQLYHLYQEAEKTKSQGYTLVLTQKAHLPFSFFGYFFKSQVQETLAEDQYQITEHELAHIQGWHSIDVLFMEIISIAMWCSPPIYLYRRSLRVVHEYIADAAVLRTSNRKHYGQMLIRQSQSGVQIALVNHLIHSQLKKRIFMMTKNKSHYAARYKYLLLVPLLFFMLATFANTGDALGKKEKSSSQIAEPTFTDLLGYTAPVAKLGDVDEMPRFPGCETESDPETRKNCANKHLFGFIFKVLKYPKEAEKANIEGKVVVRFGVEPDGRITDPTIVKGLGAGCDEEVLRVIGLMPNWIPGKKDGKAVKVEMNLPIQFKLGASDTANTSQQGEAFNTVEEMPRFPGCEADLGDFNSQGECAKTKLMQYIFQNIKYPKEAQKEGLEGMVVIGFVVDKTGQVTEPEILRSVSPSIDKEVLRLVNSMPKWVPGKEGGKEVAVHIKLPVKFKLDSKETASPTPLPTPAATALQIDNFKVSPNPTEGIFNLAFTAVPKPVTVIISNEAGKELYRSVKKDFDGNYQEQFDLSSSTKGTLIISVQQGEQFYTSKLILQ